MKLLNLVRVGPSRALRGIVSPSLALALLLLPTASAQNRILDDARHHPDNFALNRAAGELLIQRKDFSAAIPFLERARQANADNYSNNYDLALAYFTSHDLDRSHALLAELLRQSPKAELHNLLADVAEAQGQFNEAAREYEAAARIDPSEKNLFDLGSDLLKHRQFTPALQVFTFAAGKYEKSSQLWVGLGVAHYSLGQYDDAVATLCRAVDLAPNDARALDFLGKMPGISPHYAQEVTRRLQHFAAVYPASAPANYYYAMSLLDATSTPAGGPALESAQEHLRRAIALSPGFGEAHYALGTIFEAKRNQAEAIREYKLAITSDPKLTKAHYRLARLYRRTGQTALARKEFADSTSAKSDPE